MKLQIETAALDVLMVQLFNDIDESNMPWLLAATTRLREYFDARLIDLVPSYTTLMLHYDILQLGDTEARRLVHQALENLAPAPSAAGQLHELPVWYDASVGPDLLALAAARCISAAALIDIHCGRDYQVFCLGFVPGFAYMGMVDESITAPRLATPRRRVPAGSVGIAERQTAVYPMASPGGWNILGRTPARLFDREMDGYSLLKPGDRVRFIAVDRAEFVRLGGDDTPMEMVPLEAPKATTT